MRTARQKITRIGNLLFGCAVVLAFGTRGVSAAPWEFGAIVDAGVVYTDNLTLAAEDQEEEELVYTITPTFRLNTDGDRLTADIRYRPEAYFYDDESEFDEVFHIVDGNLTGTLVRDALFVFAGASNFQSIVTPDRRIPTSNIPITGNRINARTLELRPYWEQSLGFADVLLELAQVDTDFGELDTTFDGVAQDNIERRGLFELNNYSNQRGIAWGVNYEHRRLEYDVSTPWDYQRAVLDLGYWVSSSTRLFASGGLETDFDDFIDSGLEADLWEVGFQYRPNQRLNLELAAGERSYGDSYRAEFSYQLRRGETALTYTEQPSTLGELLLDQNPIIDTDNLDDFLNRPDGSDRFVRKRAEWITTVELSKSDISLRVFYEDRDQRTEATGEALIDEEQSGAAFRWTWRFGAKSILGLYADHSTRETAVAGADLTRFALDYEYRLTQRLSIVLFAQRTEEDGDSTLIPDYAENQYRLLLRANL